jgi:hypothetical protein
MNRTNPQKKNKEYLNRIKNVVFPSKQRNAVHPSIQYNRRLLENKQTGNYNDRQAYHGYIVETETDK